LPPEPGFLRTGENGEAFHQQRVANAVVIIDGDGDDGARLKAPGGAADAHAALLAQAIKGAIEAADLPAAKASWVSQAMAATVINAVTIMSPEGGVPGKTRGAVFVGWRLTPYPTYSFVARISAAPSGNL
jgi:hypothetical protein